MATASPLKWIRKQVFGLPQDRFAEVLGASRLQVSRYERGENAPPFTYLARLRVEGKARCSDFSADWFFEIPPVAANDVGPVNEAESVAPSEGPAR